MAAWIIIGVAWSLENAITGCFLSSSAVVIVAAAGGGGGNGRQETLVQKQLVKNDSIAIEFGCLVVVEIFRVSKMKLRGNRS